MTKVRNIMIALLVAAVFPVAPSASARDSGFAQQGWENGQRRIDNPDFSNRDPGYDQSGFREFGSRDIDRLQERQRARILQGLRSGELTRREANRLIAEQRMIQLQERRYRADGVLTRDERRELWQDLNAAGRHIYNEMHDAQERR